MTTKQKKRKLEADPLALARAFADRYKLGKDRDVGDVYAGIWDIYDSTIELYGALLPRIAVLENSTNDDLVGELIDLYWEMKHIRDHSKAAIRGLRGIAKTLGSQLPPG